MNKEGFKESVSGEQTVISEVMKKKEASPLSMNL